MNNEITGYGYAMWSEDNGWDPSLCGDQLESDGTQYDSVRGAESCVDALAAALGVDPRTIAIVALDEDGRRVGGIVSGGTHRQCECEYCGADIVTNPDAAVPSLHDDEAWAELAEEHGSGCEWIATRAHRWELPPVSAFEVHDQDRGQIVTREYAIHDGRVWRRSFDASDRSESFASADLSDVEDILGDGDWSARDVAPVADRMEWV